MTWVVWLTVVGFFKQALRKELEKITKNLEEMQQRLDHDAAAALPTTRKEHDDAISKLTMIEKNKQNLQKAIDTLDKSKVSYLRVNFIDFELLI